MNIDETREGRFAYGGLEPADLEGQNPPSRWRRLSNEKILITIISIVCVIVLTILILNSTGKCDTQIDLTDVCLTPECIHEASRTLQYLDTSINPCDDFYHFSCGNYVKTNRIPDNEMIVSVLGDIDDRYREQLRAIIENNLIPSNLSPFSVLHNFYTNCMDKKGIEKIGLQTILNIFKNFGGWPVVEGDSWRSDQFQWIDTIRNFTVTGFSTDYIFQFYNSFNFTNATQHSYIINQPKLGLSSQILEKGFNDSFVKAYYKYMIDVAVILGANRTRAEEELKTMMEFQINLAKSFVPLEDQRNLSHYNNPMTMREIEEQYGNIPWNEYSIKVLFRTTPFKNDDILTVYTPSYIANLNNLIQQTANRTLANFIFWRSIESVVKYLPDVIREAELNFKTVREGILERTPRWKECIDNSIKSIDSVVTFVYHQAFFNEAIVNSTKSLVNEIHQEFLNMIEEVDWMDKETKERALDKAKAIKMKISDEYKVQSLQELQNKYKYLKLELDGDYLKSFLILSKYNSYGYLDNFNNENNEKDYRKKLEWKTVDGPALLNPTYNFFHNQIDIPAGILQNPFMNENRPKYINHGTIGFIVGHEITHGFDDQGHQFDKHGNLNDWWNGATKEQYLTKTKCLVYQYGNFSSEEVGEKLNGIVSLGENMADNGAVKVTHLSYEKWIKENGPEKKLPGLDYTPLQLFWINLAQMWCSKYRPQVLRELIVSDHHSPEEFRIKGSVSNSPEFAKDFQCPNGSKMNPVTKCSIW